MGGIYSKGKALLEVEQLKKQSIEPLDKAKMELEKLLVEVQRMPSIGQDVEWLSGISNIIQKAIVNYDSVKAELKARLDDMEKEQKDQLRISLHEVLQKSNGINNTFEEIKEVLNQIFRAVTQDAELKHRTYENINAELGK